MGRPHRRLVAVLLTLAVLSGFVGTLAVWVNRQALNTNNWTDTSGRLLANLQIEKAVGDYLVAQVFDSLGVSDTLGGALPKPVDGLAAPVTKGARGLAERIVPKLLATDEAERLWRKANRIAHMQLMRILTGGSGSVSTGRGVVTLDLHPLLQQLISRIGVLRQLGIEASAGAGRIVIMRSGQLKTAQDIVVAIRGLAVVFTILPLALCALALRVAEGWRAIVLRRVGGCVVGLGIALLAVRQLIGHTVVDNLVTASTVRGAATAAWLIGTSLLRDIAIALVAYGLIILVASWLGGTSSLARRLRSGAAPMLIDRPVATYGLLAGVMLVLVVWSPTPPLRSPLPVLGICVLLVIGVEALRRQARQERARPRSWRRTGAGEMLRR